MDDFQDKFQTEITRRGLSFAELFRAGAFVYRRNLKYVALITLLVYLPLIIITGLIPVPDMITNPKTFTEMLAMPPTDLLNATYATFRYLTSSIGVTILFRPLAMAAAVCLALCGIQNRPVAVPELLDSTLQQWGKLVLTYFLFSILFFGGAFFLMIPSVFVGVVFYFCVQITASTGKFGLPALKESAAIMRGRFFSALWFIICVGILDTSVKSLMHNLLSFGSQAPAINIFASVIAYGLCIYFEIVLALWFWNMNYVRKNAAA